MDEQEIRDLVGALAPVIKSAIAAQLEPLSRRIAVLEERRPEPGPPGEPGAPGPSAEQVAELVRQAVQAGLADVVEPERRRITALEERAPARGEQGPPGEPGAPGPSAEQVAELVRQAVEAGLAGIVVRHGKDGVGLAGALVDREGRLVLTLSDGTVRELGAVVGRDGQDGEPGRPGRDGLGFENYEQELAEDGRTLVCTYRCGDVVVEKRHTFAVILDRGVWREGEFRKGDAVTFGGSLWIAQRDTAERPQESDAWRLAVKRGRDGKDGKPPPPPAGPKQVTVP